MVTPVNQDPFIMFDKLPAPLRAYLFSAETDNKYQKLIKEFKPEEIKKISGLVGEIDLGYEPLKNLVHGLIREFKWPEDKAKKFATDVAGFRYLPVAELIKTNVWAQIEEWGGDPKKYPVVKVEVRRVTAETLLEEILRDARLTLEPRLIERVKHLVMSRLANVREDAALKTMLTRAEKTGGAAFSESEADRLLGIIKLKLATVQIVESTEMASPLTAPKTEIPSPSQPSSLKRDVRPSVSVPVPVKDRPTLAEAMPGAKKFIPSPPKTEEEIAADAEPPLPKPKTFATVLPEDEKEIAEITRGVTRIKSAEAVVFEQSFDASVNSIIRESKIPIKPELKDRFWKIVDNRFRDVRDAEETRMILKTSFDKAGMGFNDEQAEKTSRLIEAEFLAYQGKLRAEKMREQERFKDHMEMTKQTKTAEGKQTEKEGLDRRYAETIKKSEKLKGMLTPGSGDRVQGPVPTPKQTTPYPLHPTPSPKAPAMPKLSPGSVPSSGKPTVEDVKFARKTAGPAEELRAMTITEFRRLSADPREATLKIKDKIELLKEETYERYVAGIRGWQDSEPNRLYLETTRAALSTGEPVPAIIAKHTAANQPSLTIEEFQAILALNGQLRF